MQAWLIREGKSMEGGCVDVVVCEVLTLLSSVVGNGMECYGSGIEGSVESMDMSVSILMYMLEGLQFDVVEHNRQLHDSCVAR